MEEAARGDGGADVLVGVDHQSVGVEPIDVVGGREEVVGVEALDTCFFEEEASAVLADDEMNLVSRAEELLEEPEAVCGSGCSGDSEDKSACFEGCHSAFLRRGCSARAPAM